MDIPSRKPKPTPPQKKKSGKIHSLLIPKKIQLFPTKSHPFRNTTSRFAFVCSSMDSSPLQPGGETPWIPPVGGERTVSQKIPQCHRPKFGLKGLTPVYGFGLLEHMENMGWSFKLPDPKKCEHHFFWEEVFVYRNHSSWHHLTHPGRLLSSNFRLHGAVSPFTRLEVQHVQYLKLNLILIVDSRISGC